MKRLVLALLSAGALGAPALAADCAKQYKDFWTNIDREAYARLRSADQHESRSYEARRAPPPGALAGEQRNAEHGEGQGRERQAGLQRVVAEDELQVDRERDQQSPERYLLEDPLEDPEAEQLRREQRGIEERGLALALPADEPVHERSQRSHPEHEKSRHGFAALLPDEDAEHDAAHADDG